MDLFDTVTWTVTDKLGDAQYDTGLYGPADTWFEASSSSTYAGDWVYIGEGTTYYSLNDSATGPTSWQSADAGTWQHTYAGQWSCFDGSEWYTTTGFNVAPADVWFHGFRAQCGV